MHAEKSICAVVVTFNRKKLLLNCLGALKAQTRQLSHIVVIDNASTDGTADFLVQHNWTNSDFFTLITLPENMRRNLATAFPFKYVLRDERAYLSVESSVQRYRYEAAL